MKTLIKKKHKERLIKINSDEHRLALTSSSEVSEKLDISPQVLMKTRLINVPVR
jgi:hypothetical protein